VPVTLKRFLAADFVFIFGIVISIFLNECLSYFLGAIIMSILLPSNFGIDSTLPKSAKA
jgi:hypothetical protein